MKGDTSVQGSSTTLRLMSLTVTEVIFAVTKSRYVTYVWGVKTCDNVLSLVTGSGLEVDSSVKYEKYIANARTSVNDVR